MLLNGEDKGVARVLDLLTVIPAITGKVELVYEGEQEGPKNVALRLIGNAIRRRFPQLFPDPEMVKRKKLDDPYANIIEWFSQHELEFALDETEKDYRNKLDSVEGLREVVVKYAPGLSEEGEYVMMDFVLHALAEYSKLSKHEAEGSLSFSDLFDALFSADDDQDFG
jgi:magnesium chelatase subunit I